MSNRNKIILIIIGILILVIGIALGVFIKNFPFVKYKNEIDLISFLTFIVTLGISILFPFFIKKWIDDNQLIKNYLIKEIELLETIILNNKFVLDKCLVKKSVEANDKDAIQKNFFNYDLQLESLQKQLEISFPRNMSLIEELKNNYNEYHHFLTGGELMTSNFTIDNRFTKEHGQNLNKLILQTKKLIHNIHKI